MKTECETFFGDPARTLSDLKNLTFTSFLDLSRWSCAWIVFLGHLRNPLFFGYESLSDLDRPFLVKGWYFVTGWFGEAVIVFFVLSGYLVGAVGCAKVSVGRFSPKEYAIARASRVFLPFIPAILLTVLLDSCGAVLYRDLGYYTHLHPLIHEKIATDPFESYLTTKNVLMNLAMLQTIVSPPLGSNQPLWTISLEFWFYVVFGLGITSLRSDSRSRRWVGGAAAVLLAMALGQGFLINMGLWAIGVVVAFVSSSRVERPALALLVFVFLLIVIRLRGSGSGHGELILVRNYLVAVSFAWLLLSMRRVRFGFLERLCGFNSFVAGFSYSLYLIHFPLMLFVLGALHASNTFEAIARGYSPTDWRGLVAYGTVAGVVGVCAWAFASLTEQQTPRLRLAFKRRFSQHEVYEMFDDNVT
jgi:peptidoglycan/LPS O-acetylase OafA/YrhL